VGRSCSSRPLRSRSRVSWCPAARRRTRFRRRAAACVHARDPRPVLCTPMEGPCSRPTMAQRGTRANLSPDRTIGGLTPSYRGRIADEVTAAVAKAPVNPALMTAGRTWHATSPASARPVRRLSRLPCLLGAAIDLRRRNVLQIWAVAALSVRPVAVAHTLRPYILVSEASRLAYADRGRGSAIRISSRSRCRGSSTAPMVRARSRLIDPMHAMGIAMPGMPPMRKAQLLDFAPRATAN
jgi:hypothetical protein